MPSPEQEQRFDQALDDLLEGNFNALSSDLDPELLALLPVARGVHSALANTPPPPHGLRPGRSAFLTAAANQKAEQRSRLAIPLLGRAFNWLAPIVAVLVMAVLLASGLFFANASPVKNSDTFDVPSIFLDLK